MAPTRFHVRVAVDSGSPAVVPPSTALSRASSTTSTTSPSTLSAATGTLGAVLDSDVDSIHFSTGVPNVNVVHGTIRLFRERVDQKAATASAGTVDAGAARGEYVVDVTWP